MNMRKQTAIFLFIAAITASRVVAADSLSNTGVIERSGYFYALRLGSQASLADDGTINLQKGKILISTKINSPGTSLTTPFASLSMPGNSLVVVAVNKKFLKVLNLSDPGNICTITFSASSGILKPGESKNKKNNQNAIRLIAGEQLLARSIEPKINSGITFSKTESTPAQAPEVSKSAPNPVVDSKNPKPNYFTSNKDPQIAPGTTQVSSIAPANMASTAIMLQELNKGLTGKGVSDAMRSITALTLVSPWYYKHYDPELYRYYSMGYDYTQGQDLDFTDMGISSATNSDGQTGLDSETPGNVWQQNDADGDIDLGNDLEN